MELKNIQNLILNEVNDKGFLLLKNTILSNKNRCKEGSRQSQKSDATLLLMVPEKSIEF